MAGFHEVMKQWGRLCRQHCAENADDCDGCILGGTRADVCGSYARDNAEDAAEIERLVMEWAAEHPEPVYPTWGEWLQTLYKSQNYAGIFITPIPADIAAKLGIEPKEDGQ